MAKQKARADLGSCCYTQGIKGPALGLHATYISRLLPCVCCAGDPLYAGTASVWIGLLENTTLRGRAAYFWEDGLPHNGVFAAGVSNFAHPNENQSPGSSCIGEHGEGWRSSEGVRGLGVHAPHAWTALELPVFVYTGVCVASSGRLWLCCCR